MKYQARNDLLAGKIILVTGAGDGIGYEAARCYAAHGARLIVLGRTESKLRKIEREIAGTSQQPTIRVVFDLLTAKALDYQQLANELSAQIPHLDGLLNNAGLLGEIKPIAEQDPGLWRDVMQVNVNAQFMLTQALLPLLLKASNPSLIFTSSSVGRKGRKGWGAYSVSKFATEGLMQVLADEYQDSHLRINCINPGGTRTGMRASAFPDENPGKLRTPADIMPTYLYLMGDDSLTVSGQSLDAQPDVKPGAAR